MTCCVQILIKYKNISDLIELHFNYPVSESKKKSFYLPLDDTSEKHLKKVGDVGTDLLEAFNLMGGFGEAEIVHHRLIVEKGSLYRWIDFMPQIVETAILSIPEGCEDDYNLVVEEDGEVIQIITNGKTIDLE